MQKIVPHLWFDKEAKEAADFYTTLFPDSRVTSPFVLKDTPSGDCDVMSFTLWGHPVVAISAGPMFKLNPSISLMVNFDPSLDPDARKRIDDVWAKLADGGSALMPLDKYPFSERYGWIRDRYGLTWQLILTNPEGEPRPTIMPAFLFVGDVWGKAEEAGAFYTSVFKDSTRGMIARYPAGLEPDKEGTVMFSEFALEGDQRFVAMDSAREHGYSFNEAFSLLVNCETQDEIDYYWGRLSADPKAEVCGWLKDKYGVSWQIVPTRMNEMLEAGDDAAIARVQAAFMKMKKFDLAELEAAYSG